MIIVIDDLPLFLLSKVLCKFCALQQEQAGAVYLPAQITLCKRALESGERVI